MGTETQTTTICDYFDGDKHVKLNNPLMGTETFHY